MQRFKHFSKLNMRESDLGPWIRYIDHEADKKKLRDTLEKINNMCFASRMWPEHMHQAVLKDISTVIEEASKDGK